VIEAAGARLHVGFEDYWRPTAANYWGRAKKAHSLDTGRQILGDRWARDHADDKKPVLAAALETAFDIQRNAACVNLGQAARDEAAAWLPPGMAFANPDRAVAEDDAADRGPDPDQGDDDPDGFDQASEELPVFLTEEGLAALNGAEAR
jgi:ParB family transcriptional regulator, chromosome partitioning protein